MINEFAEEIKRISHNSVDLPTMPTTATITSISGKKANIKFQTKGKSKTDKTVPILQPNYKLEGVDGEGRNLSMKMKIDLKKGDRVLLAYVGGNFKSPVIIGKI